MVDRSTVGKRKKPVQRRSRELVDALVEAASRLVRALPTERLSTVRIAEVAGVSVGSLYQYFADKKALLIELVDRRIVADVATMVESARRSSGDSLEHFVRTMLTAQVAMFSRDRKLYARLLPLVPALGLSGARRRAIADVSREVDAVVRTMPNLRERDQALSSFIATHAINGVLSEAVVEQPEILDHPKLVDELALLVTRYLLDRSAWKP